MILELKKILHYLKLQKIINRLLLFIFLKSNQYKKQEAQQWWISKSLQDFTTQLNNLNIKLEIIKTESYKHFFEKLILKKNFSIYWNKVYEPNYLKFDIYLSKIFEKKNIHNKIFKGNILNEVWEIKKEDGTPFKVFTPFWRRAEKHYLEKIPSSDKKIIKCKKKISFFKNSFNYNDILPNKSWVNKFEENWHPSEENALKELKNLLKIV